MGRPPTETAIVAAVGRDVGGLGTSEENSRWDHGEMSEAIATVGEMGCVEVDVTEVLVFLTFLVVDVVFVVVLVFREGGAMLFEELLCDCKTGVNGAKTVGA